MKNSLIKGAIVLALAAVAITTLAEDKISPEEFAEEASAKGIAEIETAKIALETSQSSAVKNFARKMIQDHTAANQELATIAKSEGLNISDEAGLMNQAKAFILDQREGESFNIAYANNQVAAHEQTIKLFEKAIRSDNPKIRSFAQKTLPKLKQHLQEARQLVETTKQEEKDNKQEKDKQQSNPELSREVQ